MTLRVVVTGGTGQLGRALGLTAPRFASVMAPSRSELDIRVEEQVNRYIDGARPDLIINAAGYTAVDKAESDREGAVSVNVDGARNLARAAATRESCRLIHVSTDFVFDGAASSPYATDSPAAPINVYGATKEAGEREVLKALPRNAVILRTAWLYSLEGQNFLLTMLRLLRERRLVRVVADQVGTPTSTTSLANVVWAFAEHAEVAGIYHWTDAGVASWYDFAVAIAEEAVVRKLVPTDVAVEPITTAEYPTPARRPRFSVLDKSQTFAVLGVRPMHWRESLRAVLDRADVPPREAPLA